MTALPRTAWMTPRQPRRLLPLVAAPVAVAIAALGFAAGFPDPAVDQREAGLETLASQPLRFVPNRGQTDERVVYYGQAPGLAAYFMPGRVRYALERGDDGVALDLVFRNARQDAVPHARYGEQGVVNYLKGDDPLKRHVGLPTYREIVYRDLWPRIDIVFRGTNRRLEYELVARPGADVKDIRLAYGGAEAVGLGTRGELLIRTPAGMIADAAPRTYQPVGGRRRPVESGFSLAEQGTSYGFAVGKYDQRRTLVIDPGIAYSVVRGPGEGDGIVPDGEGNTYVTGEALGVFPATPGAYDPTLNGFDDAFVTKISRTGQIVYSTFLGGEFDDRGFGVDVDSHGNPYVVGDTTSSDFPTTPGAYDRSLERGSYEGFVTKLSRDGSQLEYSTLLGGKPSPFSSLGTSAFHVAVDDTGRAYVHGDNSAPEFPVTPNAIKASSAGNDSFLTKFSPNGSNVEYSTLIAQNEYGSGGLALDDRGAAYVSGATSFADVPTTPGAFAPTPPSGENAYVVKIETDGSLAYGTYVGGSGNDRSWGIGVDGQRNAYIAGDTNSANFPTTAGAQDQTFNGGGQDAFAVALSPNGSHLVYGTYLGGTAYDGGPSTGIAVDRRGHAYAVGRTGSDGFPTTPDGFQTARVGGSDVFLVKLDLLGMVSYGAYLGGGDDEFARNVAIDALGDVYVTGGTDSQNFPKAGPGGIGGAFATKIDVPPGLPANLMLAPRSATNTSGDRHCVIATVRDGSAQPVPDVPVEFRVTGIHTAGGGVPTDSGGQATFCYTGDLFGSDNIRAWVDFNPQNGEREQFADPPEPQGEATKDWTLPAPCSVKVTGSGSIGARNGDSATFGGPVKSSTAGVTSGEPRFDDPGPAEALSFRSTEILRVSCGPALGKVSVFGRGTTGGANGVAYRIEFVDAGEPGEGRDTYRILLSTGYDSGSQKLLTGNVQVHG